MGSETPLTEAAAALSLSDLKPVPFGREMAKQFPLDPKYKNLNHGSYGTFPTAVLKELRKYQDEMEFNPEIYIRYAHTSYLLEPRKAIANLLNVPVKEVVYVKNATTGVNTILRNLVYAPGDAILYFSFAYPACEKTIAHLMETTPVTARKIEIDFPCSHDDIVNRFLDGVKKARAEGLNVKVALYDTIVSQPGVRLPFERLTQVCREEGILSCIDGAHGVGQIPLYLPKLGADFIVSNCHKWLFTPRGCAVLHVPVRNQHLIRTTYPTSHGFRPLPSFLESLSANGEPAKAPREMLAVNPNKTPFEQLFDWVSTNDDTPYLCIPAALKFREIVCGGEEAIMSYCETLARDAANHLAEVLGTEILCEPGVDPKVPGASQIMRTALVNIRLPIAVDGDDGKPSRYASASTGSVAAGDATAMCRWIERQLVEKHNTLVPTLILSGSLWVRISGQIYLELDDFKYLGNALKGLLEAALKGEGPVPIKKTS